MISPIHHDVYANEDDVQDGDPQDGSAQDDRVHSARVLRLGLDIGSTTVKVVVVDEQRKDIAGRNAPWVLWARYTRHYSDVLKTVYDLASEALEHFQNRSADEMAAVTFTVALTGSAGIGVSQKLELPFVQEVVANAKAVETFIPQTDVAIELGGEDAKITFFGNSIDQRMNETCAGGTGAFIDQIAVSLKTDAAGVNQLAGRHKTIYPIAARCGVFTKSDVTMLLNDGATKEDVAASVLQAVVDQTIGGLACGRKIRGNVAFLGGPLHFLPELRRRFSETLRLDPAHQLQPSDAHFYVAMGAALLSGDYAPAGTPVKQFSNDELRQRLRHVHRQGDFRETERLRPLFASVDEYDEFAVRHQSLRAARLQASGFRLQEEEVSEIGEESEVLPPEARSPKSEALYLGIDSGSTTTKAVLMDSQDRIVRSWYGSNEGDPVQTVRGILADIYEGFRLQASDFRKEREISSSTPEARSPKSEATARIAGSCVTGYGEQLLQAAFGIDDGEVETLAHYRAAAHFVPEVSFILDIGGQDIKCIYIKNGFVDKIVLNEACSSGCGSFIETFAQSLGYNVADFAQEALFAKHPIDLGTRCTVFMNSKVKQAQKENASVADISAGLAFSVAKNALYKVLKISDVSELGEHVVVQGGTFNNAAVLRAFELLIGRNVHRVDISGMMGAFGAALIAKERAAQRASGFRLQASGESMENQPRSPKSEVRSLITRDELPHFTMSTSQRRCGACSNKCLITVHDFSRRKKFISGNKCEKGAGRSGTPSKTNLFQYQYERVFDYTPRDLDNAPLGEIGIPRVLNMFENYPYWFTMLDQLGFRVVLSSPSTSTLYNKGLDSVSSQTLCFPAKLVHGHIVDLVERGVRRIFYPALPIERAEFKESIYSYNCPVVGSYPEVVRLNMDELKEEGLGAKGLGARWERLETLVPSPSTLAPSSAVDFIAPFLPCDDQKKQLKLLLPLFMKYGVTRKMLKKVLVAAEEAQLEYKADLRRKGEETVAALTASGDPAIVLAGRPYHLDPLIHHGIPELIAASGAVVLAGDMVAHLGRDLLFPLQAVDQWGYHARLYRTATFATLHPQVQMIQLTSFGCGLDAVTAEQVDEILTSCGKVHTLLKIDEGTQLGAVKIRVRSLLSTMGRRS